MSAPVQLEDRATFVRTQQKRRNSPEDKKSSNGGSVGCESQTVGRIRVGGSGGSNWGHVPPLCWLLLLMLLLLTTCFHCLLHSTAGFNLENVYFGSI